MMAALRMTARKPTKKRRRRLSRTERDLQEVSHLLDGFLCRHGSAERFRRMLTRRKKNTLLTLYHFGSVAMHYAEHELRSRGFTNLVDWDDEP